MLFTIDFAMEFSGFRVDLEPDKYFSNAFNLILLIWYNETQGLEVENEDKENIENLGPRFSLSKRGYNIYHLYLISIIFNYGIIL